MDQRLSNRLEDTPYQTGPSGEPIEDFESTYLEAYPDATGPPPTSRIDKIEGDPEEINYGVERLTLVGALGSADEADQLEGLIPIIEEVELPVDQVEQQEQTETEREVPDDLYLQIIKDPSEEEAVFQLRKAITIRLIKMDPEHVASQITYGFLLSKKIVYGLGYTPEIEETLKQIVEELM